MSPHAEAFRYDILVLGIGNLVWGDDGFGVHAVRELVPRFMGAHKVSMHQSGFQEVLSAAELLGETPESMTLVGVQSVSLDFGAPPSPPVRAQMDHVIAKVVEQLECWGAKLTPRNHGGGGEAEPPPPSLIS